VKVPLLVGPPEHPFAVVEPSNGGLETPAVLTDSTEALVPSSPREGKRLSESRGAFHRQEPHREGIAPRHVQQDAIHYAAARRSCETEGRALQPEAPAPFLPRLLPGP